MQNPDVRNKSMFFGGLPLTIKPPTIVKEIGQSPIEFQKQPEQNDLNSITHNLVSARNMEQSKPYMKMQFSKDETSYNEPLKTLSDFYSLTQKAGAVTLKHDLVTERQLVFDTIVLFQGYESPTYEKVVGKKKPDVFRISKPVQLLHVTPATLKSTLKDFLQMSNLQQRALFYLRVLENAQL